jgi:hypothetical protein
LAEAVTLFEPSGRCRPREPGVEVAKNFLDGFAFTIREINRICTPISSSDSTPDNRTA